MKTISGQLILSKTEIESLKTIIKHTKQDLSYGWNGSFGGDETAEEKRENDRDIKLAKKGLEVLDFILQTIE